MTTTELSTHSMNLNPKYVGDWGAFEAARELYANGMDADPDGCTIATANDNEFHVYTRTSPTLENVLCIGSGTKDRESDDIGQFGEGIKLAALAACRTEGASLIVEAEFGEVTYSLLTPEHYTTAVLHAHIDTTKKRDKGCLVRLVYVDVCRSVLGKFLSRDAKIGPQKKPGKANVVRGVCTPVGNTNIFVKGIWVATLEESSVYDWNLKDAGINRDRVVISEYLSRHEIGSMLCNNVETYKDLWQSLFTANVCLESNAIRAYDAFLDKEKACVLTAFHAEHGDKAVVAAVDPRINEHATNAGRKLVYLNSHFLNAEVLLKILPLAIDCKPKLCELKVAPLTKTQQSMLEEVVEVMDFLDVGAAIKVFNRDDYAGYEQVEAQASYDPKTEAFTMWLDQSLFLPNERDRRMAAVFHELSHFKAGMADAQSLKFEWTLTILGGKLACGWLDAKQGDTDVDEQTKL